MGHDINNLHHADTRNEAPYIEMEAVEPKPFWQSKTVIVAVLSALAAIFADPAVTAAIPTEWWPKLMVLQSIVMVVLRFMTDSPVKK